MSVATLNKLQQLAIDNGFRFSKTKTVYMHICQKRSPFRYTAFSGQMDLGDKTYIGQILYIDVFIVVMHLIN